MSISNVRARFGLSFTGTATREGASGTISLGLGNQDQRIAIVTQGAVARLIIAPSQVVEWDPMTHSALTAETWTTGVAQVETATAAGTATSSGNITVTVTSTGMSSSPLSLVVAISSGDTASQWAAKVRTALAANTVIAGRFAISGSGTSIILTRKPISTFVAEDGNVVFYAGNDSSLNIGIADTGSTGITPASSSANTTTGVATEGFKVYGEAVDFEGRAVPEMDRIYAFDVRSNSGFVAVGDGGGAGVSCDLKSGGRICLYDIDMNGLSFQSISDPVDVEFCIVGTVD